MAAAAKAARTEMLQRVREKKAEAPQARTPAQAPRNRTAERASAPASLENDATDKRRNAKAAPRPAGNGNGNSNGNAGPVVRTGGNRHPARQRLGRERSERPEGFEGERPERTERSAPPRREHGAERQPGPNAHLGSMRIRDPRPRAAAPGGQPDPLRTSIDALGSKGPRNNRPGPGRPGGGAGRKPEGPRGGPADPLRTSFGRIR